MKRLLFFTLFLLLVVTAMSSQKKATPARKAIPTDTLIVEKYCDKYSRCRYLYHPRNYIFDAGLYPNGIDMEKIGSNNLKEFTPCYIENGDLIYYIWPDPLPKDTNYVFVSSNGEPVDITISTNTEEVPASFKWQMIRESRRKQEPTPAPPVEEKPKDGINYSDCTYTKNGKSIELYGRVYITNSASDADLRVYITNPHSDADLKARITNSEYFADKCGVFYKANSSYGATKVYITNPYSDAELRVYIDDYDY